MASQQIQWQVIILIIDDQIKSLPRSSLSQSLTTELRVSHSNHNGEPYSHLESIAMIRTDHNFLRTDNSNPKEVIAVCN